MWILERSLGKKKNKPQQCKGHYSSFNDSFGSQKILLKYLLVGVRYLPKKFRNFLKIAFKTLRKVIWHIIIIIFLFLFVTDRSLKRQCNFVSLKLTVMPRVKRNRNWIILLWDVHNFHNYADVLLERIKIVDFFIYCYYKIHVVVNTNLRQNS